jgi:hypothetical protein
MTVVLEKCAYPWNYIIKVCEGKYISKFNLCWPPIQSACPPVFSYAKKKKKVWVTKLRTAMPVPVDVGLNLASQG